MSEPIVVVQDVVKEFEGVPVLGPVSFSLMPQRCLALLGPNGAGKSTLLNIIATLQRPTYGTLTLAGNPTTVSCTDLRRLVAYIAHTAMVYQELTALENLAFTARLYGIDDKHSTLCDLLDSVGLLHRAHDMPATFSRGMLQRLSIARALLINPALFLFDEPFTGLDLAGRQWLIEQMQRLAQHAAIVVVTHHLHEVESVMTDALILNRGQMVLHSSDVHADHDLIIHRYNQLMGGMQ